MTYHDFKYPVFLITLLFFVPLGIVACRIHKFFIYLTFACVILSTTFYASTEMTFFHKEWYKTVTWGFNVTLADLGLFVIFISMLLRRNEYPIRWFVPLTIPYTIYFIVAVISWTMTIGIELPNPLSKSNEDQIFQLWLYPLFEIWKIVRFYFATFVLINFVIDKNSIKVVISCFCLILIYLISLALSDRYVFKINSASAGMELHLFDVYVGVMGVFLFPFIFYTKSTFKKIVLSLFTISSLVGIVLSISRSGALAFFSAIIACLCFVIPRFISFKNLIVILFFALCALGIIIKASDTLYTRFNAEDVESSLEGRISLNDKAKEMALKYPFGVGPGNFAARYVIEYKKPGDEDINLAHNIFFNLGELGFPGLIAFLIIYIRIYQMTIMDLIRLRKHEFLYTIIIGCMGGLIMLLGQDLFHFISRHNSIALLMQIMTAYIARAYCDRERMIESYATFDSKISNKMQFDVY